jgi:acetylornithine deacetylase/succinyl-diaminopimelate desuccinylase-like protein
MVARARSLELAADPKTTLTVARWGGGSTVNSIPEEAWLEVDLRSEGSEELEALEGDLFQALEEELATYRDSDGRLRGFQLDTTEIGRRPAGATDPSTPLVRAAMEATRALGEEPNLASASTDANLAMSLGIPAITMGGGGTGGGIHTRKEWYENQKGPEGILRAFLVLLLLSG